MKKIIKYVLLAIALFTLPILLMQRSAEIPDCERYGLKECPPDCVVIPVDTLSGPDLPEKYRIELDNIMANPGDVNEDGLVNILDLLAIINEYKRQQLYDINHDGILNEDDINLWLEMKYGVNHD